MKRIIFSCLYLLALFLLSKFVFDPTYLYYELWWLDIPMHILGGLGVAFLTSAVLAYKHIHVSFKKVIFAYIVVAVTWELYEYIYDMLVGRDWNGWFDTIKDSIDGFIGASIAYYFIRK